MRTVTYKSVIDRIASYMGQADGLDTEDKAIAESKINFFVRLAWEHYWFPDLMEIEQRTFRPVYSSSETYAAGDQLFFSGDRNYYQALQATTGNAPATLTNGDYEVNSIYWIQCESSFSGDDFDDDRIYGLGDIARNPEDDLLYARIAGQVTSGAGTADCNTSWYQADGLTNGKPSYLRANDSSGIYWTGSQWEIYSVQVGGVVYTSTEDVDRPDQVVTWATGIYGPAPVFTANDAFTNAALWSVVTDFIRSLDYEQADETVIGDVRFIWSSNPLTNRRACRVAGGRSPDFRLRDSYLQVLGCANVVWVEFRRRPNVYTGAIRSDTATYVADDERYDVDTGDYWIANQAVSAGQSPTTHPLKWDRVEFPYVLAEFVAQSSYAMMTNKEQQTPEDFNIQMAAGYPLLLAELDRLERQQGQTRQLNVALGR